MTKLIRAALCAAVSVCAIGTADAATFVTYSITGLLNAKTYALGPGAIRENVTGNFTANFTFNLDQANIVPGGQSVGNLADSNLGVGPTGATSSTSGLGLLLQGTSSATSIVNAFACFSNPSGLLPTTPGIFAVTRSCSSVSALIQGRYYLDAPTGTINTLTVSIGSSPPLEPSFVFAIPEPSTWALMLAGFGLTGYALRRRARVAFA